MRRVDQLLANLGYCSRREARAWVEAGRVTVGGKPVRDSGDKVDPERVWVDGAALDHPGEILLVLHKPTGLTCSHDERERPLVYELLPERWRARNPVITSVGRLDKDTSGLLLLTDHAPLVHRLTSPKHKVPKRYQVELDVEAQADWVGLFGAGTLQLAGEKEPCLPAELHLLGPRRAEVVLVEGKYHQIRRMFKAVGAEVIRLHRSHFGNLTLEGLAPGQWRELPLDTFE